MNVSITNLLTGAGQAVGLTVIIDVYRAFSCAPMLFSMGIEKIIFTASPEEALQLKASMPDLLLVGEVEGKPIPGFDFGNSPYRLIASDPRIFRQKTVVQRTSAGVQGVITALQKSSQVWLGSFNLAASTARSIIARHPQEVTLVAMGWNGLTPTPEDECCARYIAHLLGRGEYDHLQSLREIVRHESTQKFLMRKAAHYPPEDPLLCLQRDIYSFVLAAEFEDGRIVVRKLPPISGDSPPRTP
jgi:2-phosphosulfolactate phosphatase